LCHSVPEDSVHEEETLRGPARVDQRSEHFPHAGRTAIVRVENRVFRRVALVELQGASVADDDEAMRTGARAPRRTMEHPVGALVEAGDGVIQRPRIELPIAAGLQPGRRRKRKSTRADNTQDVKPHPADTTTEA